MSLSATSRIITLVFVCIIATSCSTGPEGPASSSEAQYTVNYRERTIDIEPFLIGFPYSGHNADLEHGNLFYFERTENGRWLRQLPLTTEGTIDHAKGAKLTDVDWSTRSIRLGKVHGTDGKLYITADEANDEHFNVYTIDPADGAIEQITHNDYTYSWAFSDDDRYLAYLARTGLKEPFVTSLHVRDMETGEDREVLPDEGGADRFTWSAIRFTPDNKSVILTVQHDGQRNTKSLARIDLEAKAPRFEFIHPDRVTRYSLGQIDGWVSDSAFLFTSAEEGFLNVYRHDLATGKSRRSTDFKDELRTAELLETDPPTLLAVLSRPHESELQVLDAETGALLHQEVVEATISIMDGHGSDTLISENSLTSPWVGKRLDVQRSGDDVQLAWAEFAGVPDSLMQQISHYDVERVSYPTFDEADDGSPRMLRGFLLTPKILPDDPAERLVRITSFYGGRNRFDTGSQLMAAAGVATFSPAPRGSSGFGAEFAALNDGDLGGDEIVDILYAAKWLESEKGFAPKQIGVWGGSHGGYATMRALTFPPETNGRDAHFDFGFGWSHAGFSNIITFYEACNIPDWVVKEAGDPETEAEKLLARSPISHVDLLQAPLLLTHGSNDWRVPTDESRTFDTKARELGKPVTYVEFEGQGHGIRGFENLVLWYQTVLTFFETVSEDNLSRHDSIAPEMEMKALILDFDGVISDSAREGFTIAVRTYRALVPGSKLRESGDEALYRQFLELIPLGNRAEDYGTALAAIEDGRPLPDQATFDDYRESRDATWLAEYHQRFYQVRDALVAADPQAWLNLMRPYLPFAELIRRRSGSVRLAIATARDGVSVAALLQSYGLDDLFTAETVLDKDTGKSKTVHLRRLAETFRIVLGEMTFVDDKLNHLDDVASLGVRCALARWGYNGPREHEEANRRGHLVCGLDDVESQLFGS